MVRSYFGAIVVSLLKIIVSFMQPINLTFATAGAQLSVAPGAAGTGQAIGQWILTMTRLPLGAGWVNILLIWALGGIAIFLVGKWLNTFFKLGRTTFQKLFAILVIGSIAIGWILGGISGNWNPLSGLSLGMIISLIISSAVFAGIFTQVEGLKQWTNRNAGLS